jgi:HK97 gp10 family phage protein
VAASFNKLNDIVSNLRSGAPRVVATTAQTIAANARNSAPIRTGALRASITAASAGGTQWEVTASAPYAGYVEFGTAQHGAAQPFLIPAAHQQEQPFIHDIADLLKP